MKNRLIYTASLTAFAAVLVMACGNGDDDDTTPPADAGTDASVKLDSSTPELDASSGPDTSTATDGSAPTDSGPADSGAADTGVAPTFTSVYSEILGGVCKTCHGSTSGDGFTSGKLLMDTQADAYKNLVGVAAGGTQCTVSEEKRVVAGSSSTSLLWQKVATTPSCGGRMPLGEPALSQAEIDLIAGWINAGALNN